MENPNLNLNENQNEKEATLSEELQELADMPSFEKHMEKEDIFSEYEKAKRDEKLPEGVRDLQDYRDYREEIQAKEEEKRNDEKIIAEKERAEKEKLRNFDERLERNKGLFDALAEQRNFVQELYPDVDATAFRKRFSLGGFAEVIRDDQGKYYLEEHIVPAYYDKEQSKKYLRLVRAAFMYRDATWIMKDIQNDTEENDVDNLEVVKSEDISFLGRMNKAKESFKNAKETGDDNGFLRDVSTGELSLLGPGETQFYEKDIDDCLEICKKCEGMVIAKGSKESLEKMLEGYCVSFVDFRRDIEEHFSQQEIMDAKERAEAHTDEFKEIEKSMDAVIEGADVNSITNYLNSTRHMHTTDNYKGVTYFIIRLDNNDNEYTQEYTPDLETSYRMWTKYVEAQKKIKERFDREYSWAVGDKRREKLLETTEDFSKTSKN